GPGPPSGCPAGRHNARESRTAVSEGSAAALRLAVRQRRAGRIGRTPGPGRLAGPYSAVGSGRIPERSRRRGHLPVRATAPATGGRRQGAFGAAGKGSVARPVQADLVEDLRGDFLDRAGGGGEPGDVF